MLTDSISDTSEYLVYAGILCFAKPMRHVFGFVPMVLLEGYGVA